MRRRSHPVLPLRNSPNRVLFFVGIAIFTRKWYNTIMDKDKQRTVSAIVLVASCLLASLGLAIAKMYVGLRSNSLVVTLDGMNSFFDVATGVVTVVAFCVLFVPRSERHPHGFGRGEYLAGFVVACVTVVMGVVFLFRSVGRLAMAEPVYYRLSSMIIILVALVVKVGMTVAYGVVNRRVRSYALRALLLDSVLDVGVTAVSVASFTISQAASYAADAWFGIALSVVVMALGVKMVVDNTRLLLGAGDVSAERDAVRRVLAATVGIDAVRAVVLSDFGYRCKAGYAEVVFSPALSVEEAAEVAAEVRASLAEEGVDVRLVPVCTDAAAG